MAKKKLKCNVLSVSSIQRLQKDLQKYSDSLEYKCKELAERLSELGVNVANVYIGKSPLGKYVTLKTEISPEQMGCRAILTAVGEVKQSDGYADFNTLLAIEFGAGIHHNPIPNPKAADLGFGVGTFPEQIHAFEDGWFYFDEKKQKWMYTHGVKATMPMYNADIEIINKCREITKDVFSS